MATILFPYEAFFVCDKMHNGGGGDTIVGFVGSMSTDNPSRKKEKVYASFETRTFRSSAGTKSNNVSRRYPISTSASRVRGFVVPLTSSGS